jgi:hypothetical protein
MPKVLTHRGFKSFDGVLVSTNKDTKIIINILSGEVLKCTQDHRLKLLNKEFIKAKNLKVSDILYNNKIITSISYYDSDEFVYDLINVQDTNSYITNNVISHNCVMMDEFAHVPNGLALEFFTSTYPVISSGKSTKIIIVSTPRGMNLFYKMWCDAISGKSDYKAVDIHWSRVPGRDEEFRTNTIKNTSLSQWNQEFGCEFLGSVNTLVDSAKLQTMGYQEYIDELFGGMQIFQHPIQETFCDETKKQLTKDHMYVVCADVSEGKNLDYTTFSIFDCSVLPYQQVATYRNNMIIPMLFPDVLKLCAEYYNNAHVLVEINNNPQIADCLHQDLEYENVFQISAGNKQSQTLTYEGRNPQNGLNMSPAVKRLGCSTLKTLIETNKLTVNDFITISELTTFTVNKGSFSAEEGSNDDMCMTLVIFAWLTTQKLFIELSSTDIRKQLQIDNNYVKETDEDSPPMVQFQSGLEKNYVFEGGDMWEVVEQIDDVWF